MIIPQEHILLSQYTTFKIGGPARYFFQATDVEGVKEALHWAREHKQKTYLLGGGSNVLVSDAGFDGLVIRLGEAVPEVRKDGIRAFAGCRLMSAVEAAQKNGFSGMERLAGIPGSIGGAVCGNAGAFGVEIKDAVSSVLAVHAETVVEKRFTVEKCEFGYRQSYFKVHREWIVVSADFSLAMGDTEHLLTIMEDTIAQRNGKQLQDVKSAGSYFINPVIEDEGLRRVFEEETGNVSRDKKVPAGWLIDRTGLRGKRIGNAMVSEQHPNYILNVGNATAEEVIILESYIKQQVRDRFNVELQCEVRYVGF